MTSEDDLTSIVDEGSLGLLMLKAFPPFLRLELADDKAFRDKLGIEVGATVSIGLGAARFRQDVLFNAIRSALSSGNTTAVQDEVGTTFTIVIETDSNGRKIITASKDELSFRLAGFGVVSTDPDQRLKELEFALVTAGLPPNGTPTWRRILEERPLEDEEIGQFLADLSRTPQANIGDLSRELASPQGKLETIAPSEQIYYERLVGPGDAQRPTDLSSNVTRPHISNLLSWDQERGAQMALLLASRAGIVTDSPLVDLPSGLLARLAPWARNSADLLSKLGMIELGLATLPKAPQLEAVVEALGREIVSLNPDDPSSRLRLLMGAFVLIDGELSRSKALVAWPPFRRRHAALAQASLFERLSFGRLDVERFSNWAFNIRAHRFYLQTLVDMRLEPRWPPDYAGPEQFHRELLGRIYNASVQYADNVQSGTLHEFLFGDSHSGLRKALHFPGSFVPGPLEGSSHGQENRLPPEFKTILDESLSGDQLESKSVIALINLRGLFHIDSTKIAKAVSLIREARHRFASHINIDERDALISGLASVASTTRSKDLASDVRVLMRKIRVEELTPPRSGRELLVALDAAAAYEAQEDWLDFVGDWSRELAFSVTSVEDAKELHAELDTLCVIEPALRKSLGRALAALAAYISV